MTLIKSLLLGSAAGVVAVSAAQAADLPTRKGPVAAEYVRVCSITVAGAPVVGFVLPGSDTCIKFSGYLTGQIEGGNLKQGYNYAIGAAAQTTTGAAGIRQRDAIGYSTRLNFTIDTVSNTAYGPLVAHAELQSDYGAGFNSVGSAGNLTYLNRAYVSWAGLTAGKANSFFSFTGGGPAWANFFSPDRQGSSQPDLLAYTASFGGGFAASIALEDPATGGVNAAVGGSRIGFLTDALVGGGTAINATWDGLRVPDIVGSLDVKQAWGGAHLAGVAHEVRATGFAGTIDKWGFALDAGVQFNIPNVPGALIAVTGAWSKNATWYSGIPDGMWGEAGEQTNGNGQGMALADAYNFVNAAGGSSWATPTAWSVTAYTQFNASQQVTLAFEGSYGQVSWSDKAITGLYDSKSFIVGGVANYTPVHNLVFEFELLYQNSTNDRPSTIAVGTPWQGKSDGFAARFEVTRNF